MGQEKHLSYTCMCMCHCEMRLDVDVYVLLGIMLSDQHPLVLCKQWKINMYYFVTKLGILYNMRDCDNRNNLTVFIYRQK